MKKGTIISAILTVLFFSALTFGQISQGPATGNMLRL